MYRNLELQIIRHTSSSAESFAPQYRVIAGIDGARPSADFRLPVTQEQAGAIRLGMADPDVARTFGAGLFASLFQGAIAGWYRTLRQDTASQIRLQLRLSDVPEIAWWPWELLFDPDNQEYCALSRGTSIVRAVDQPFQPSPLKAKLPLKLMAVYPSPTTLDELDSDKEWARLQEGLAGLTQAGWLTLERLVPPTRSALEDYAEGFHIFHFTGHGESGADFGGVLAFETEDGVEDVVTGQELARLLVRRDLRLAVLNACRSGTAVGTDQFSGVAQRLLLGRLPAVVAMQAPVAETSATLFAQHLYRQIGLGDELDDAVTAGRIALSRNGGTEWAIPVLFLQGADGHLFDLPPVTPQARRLLELRGIVAQVEHAMQRNDLKSALSRGPLLKRLGQGDLDAERLIPHIERWPEVLANYSQAELAYQSGEWLEAWRAFDKVQAAEGDYQDTYSKIAECSRRVQSAVPIDDVQIAPTLNRMVELLSKGQLVFVLGSRANRCGRPPSDVNDAEPRWLPDHLDLAQYLASLVGTPMAESGTLPWIAEYLATRDNREPYATLVEVLERDWPVTMLHGFLCRLPSVLRSQGVTFPNQVILTVNYDDALERAFDDVGEPYDVVRYIPKAQGHLFVHRPWRAREDIPITVPNRYTALPVQQGRVGRCLIVKVYGAIDRSSADLTRYVLTEDDYIDYVPDLALDALLPATLQEYFYPSSFLFLGYDLYPWSMRTFLKRFWRPERKAKSWSVPFEMNEIANHHWAANRIAVIDARSEDFVAALNARVKNVKPFRV